MDPTLPSEADATSIRLAALEERVRLLETVAGPATPTGNATELRSARGTRAVIGARLAALGHPSRLELLDGITRGATTTSELAAELGTSSTGQLYHHLNQLVAAGWLQTTARGRYEIPTERRSALVTILRLVSPG